MTKTKYHALVVASASELLFGSEERLQLGTHRVELVAARSPLHLGHQEHFALAFKPRNGFAIFGH